ncbi:hypothetical protein MPH_09085 [Macrophomina phaseolina MS6]|uniref:Secreted protein n=1 Tax=Macrophomina phaseolina (strain MS6) TaxID=1126212 RepID=K2QVM1_MACPH|nr:hypothetical protein MPH_09085 [Macrophomina phaseolina MS6]
MRFTFAAATGMAFSASVAALPALSARASSSGCSVSLNSTLSKPANPGEIILMRTMLKWSNSTGMSGFSSVSPSTLPRLHCRITHLPFLPISDIIRTSRHISEPKLTYSLDRATPTGPIPFKTRSRSSSTRTPSPTMRPRMS